ncbi:PKD domain-containing protein [candidate division WOR-3 bacterium]|nr:PKD domain-containing protein [candidate division WOR-3 bacterium]
MKHLKLVALLALIIGCFCCEHPQEEHLQVKNVDTLPPVADFYAKPTKGKAPLYVEFYDFSKNEPTSRYWKLENAQWEGIQQIGYSLWGNSLWGPVVSVSYDEAGTYDATLIVSNAAGVDTLTKKDYIHVLPPEPLLPPEPPIADFLIEPTEGKAPLDVLFYNQSKNADRSLELLKCTFCLGDENIKCRGDYSGPLRYIYCTPGTYTVTLIVRDVEFGLADTLIRKDYITVTDTGLYFPFP